MVYMLDTVFERVPEDMAVGVVKKELELRRDILVSELGVYRSADPAWELPGLLSFRSADSADGCGSDGQVVREFVNSYGLTVWSPSDFPEGGAMQLFDVDSGRRHVAYYDRWAAWGGESGSVATRWTGFPPMIPSAPWGRPGYEVGPGRGPRRGARRAHD